MLGRTAGLSEPLLELHLIMQSKPVPSEYSSPQDAESSSESLGSKPGNPTSRVVKKGSLEEVCEAGLKEQEGFYQLE